MVNRQVCPFHADEDVAGVRLNDSGEFSFVCASTKGHPTPGPYRWLHVPEPAGLRGLSGLAEELGLRVKLPAAIAQYLGQWVEYGAVEAAYAAANPRDFARLVDQYGHTAIKETSYSASSFLSRTLGRLTRTADAVFHDGPATGRWSYNRRISWWTLSPEPDWDSQRTSWESLGESMDYVPGSVEH